MELKSKIFAAVLGLCAQLSFVTPTQAELIQTSDRALPQAVFVPNTGPEQRSLTPVSFSPLVVAGEVLGEVVVYDDPTTKRPADYLRGKMSPKESLCPSWRETPYEIAF